MDESTSYLLAPSDEKNSTRLSLLQDLYDARTIERLQSIGVGEGWKCFAPGAGEGSIVQWLSGRVGHSGSVLATDINPRLQYGLSGNITWREHHLLLDPMPDTRFDLVWVRLLIMHLIEPLTALRRIASVLRPGGSLLIEEYELQAPAAGTPAEVIAFWQGVERHWQQRALNFSIGKDLEALLDAAGLRCQWVQRSLTHFDGASPEAHFHRITALSLREMFLASGALTPHIFDAAMDAFSDPTQRLYGPSVTAAAAQK